MDNLFKIKRIGRILYFLLSCLLVIVPLTFLLYWAFINHLPETLITVNRATSPLIPHPLPLSLQALGLFSSLFPLAALMYGIANLRKLFAFYKEGVVFSFEQVRLFKNTAKGLLLWVALSIIYESAKSVLFSLSNPPGSRILSVGVSSWEITTLLAGVIIYVIAWVMDEGRILAEENELTI